MKAFILVLLLSATSIADYKVPGLSIDDNKSVFCDGWEIQIDPHTESYIETMYGLDLLTDAELCKIAAVVQNELNQ